MAQEILTGSSICDPAAYRRPTEEEFAEMWRLCVFAFEANMLLNTYRYTPVTQEKFFAILKRLKDRTLEMKFACASRTPARNSIR